MLTVPPPPLTTAAIAPAMPKAQVVTNIIRGGMRVPIFKWELAREVSKRGELGVISQRAIETVFVTVLRKGKSN